MFPYIVKFIPRIYKYKLQIDEQRKCSLGIALICFRKNNDTLIFIH